MANLLCLVWSILDMKKKDKEARRMRRRSSANVFVAGSIRNSRVAPVSGRRHVPSRPFKICQQVAEWPQEKSSKQKWQSSIIIRTSTNLIVASLDILMLCCSLLSLAAESLPSSSTAPASPVIVWSQPLSVVGSEWRPIVATPVDGSSLMRRSSSSNLINTTEAEPILTHIDYLPIPDLLVDTQRQVPLNQTIPLLGSDQAAAESSPRRRGGRVRSEEPEILLDEQSIQKVIPARKGKKPMEDESPPPGQFDDDENESVREGGPGERRFVAPTRARQSVARTGNQGDTSVDITLVQSAAKRPPVYMSAPKHISELSEMNKRASAVAQAEHSKKTSDLNTAAGHYKSERKKGKKKKKKVKRKVYKVKKYKKKKKLKKKKKKVTIVVKKKKKKKVKKSKPVYHHHHHHYEPKHQHHGGGGGHHHHHHDHGKYYE